MIGHSTCAAAGCTPPATHWLLHQAVCSRCIATPSAPAQLYTLSTCTALHPQHLHSPTPSVSGTCLQSRWPPSPAASRPTAAGSPRCQDGVQRDVSLTGADARQVSYERLAVVASSADVGAAVGGPAQRVDRLLVALQLRHGHRGVADVQHHHAGRLLQGGGGRVLGGSRTTRRCMSCSCC
jgi:hypothetical protein